MAGFLISLLFLATLMASIGVIVATLWPRQRLVLDLLRQGLGLETHVAPRRRIAGQRPPMSVAGVSPVRMPLTVPMRHRAAAAAYRAAA